MATVAVGSDTITVTDGSSVYEINPRHVFRYGKLKQEEWDSYVVYLDVTADNTSEPEFKSSPLTGSQASTLVGDIQTLVENIKQ